MTPRTDDFCNGLHSNCLETTQGAVDLANFARQLERELTDLQRERDQLRRVVDEFARQSPGDDKWLAADYRDLPHVIERKTK